MIFNLFNFFYLKNNILDEKKNFVRKKFINKKM
jgi:hypothetical protein